MTLPTLAALPAGKPSSTSYHLAHDLMPVSNVQRRLAGRNKMVPAVNLDAYRFRTVIDWIEFRVEFGRMTQRQHVQQVLRRFLDRGSYIKPKNMGPGLTFSICHIRVQEPKNLALIEDIHRALVNTFGEAAGSRVTAIEISVDAYPAQPSDAARATLLGALQRTIWTNRDIWSNGASRPRVSIGKARHENQWLMMGPETDGTIFCRSSSENHVPAFIDGTMYLGARDEDVMIRIMDKVIDQQNPNGKHTILSDDRKRVRIEVTLKGEEPQRMGITDIPSLRQLKMATFQKEYFQFKLPTFLDVTQIGTAKDLIHRTRETWRADTYLKTGVIGLMVMDAVTTLRRKKMKDGVRKTLRAMNKSTRNPAPDARLAPAFLSWDELNQKVNVAFQQQEKREQTAWKRMKV
ncbi:hypothetical protein [Fuscibacter oryzae]|uniref:Uncharacterized protein n=1 Tax=Fuscibacter oryzae TaxID=2803939 RepID=A0A8J7MSC4_9RHOB|nr:hypothetical protein [Fuscibacter oryzae]MBL4927779.1 hypothetical protein [Fuscibacter oryzae]